MGHTTVLPMQRFQSCTHAAVSPMHPCRAQERKEELMEEEDGGRRPQGQQGEHGGEHGGEHVQRPGSQFNTDRCGQGARHEGWWQGGGVCQVLHAVCAIQCHIHATQGLSTCTAHWCSTCPCTALACCYIIALTPAQGELVGQGQGASASHLACCMCHAVLLT